MDILFCSVPGTMSYTPVLAPALLKACAIRAGFSSTGIDLNAEIYARIARDPNYKSIEKFFKLQEIDPVIKDTIGDLIEYCGNKILSYNAKIIGLSLLTQDSQFFCLWLCHYIKTVNPDAKILIGGSGIKAYIAESDVSFAEILKTHGLINDYIYGDGEYAVVAYLKNNLSFPGINSNQWEPIKELNELPYADFDDYDLSKYDPPVIPICDSRGCVRTCEFCDIIEHWKKYQYRTADNIFAEMVYQLEKYNITRFTFYNSLTNGNMKEFGKLLDLICDYNDTHERTMSWIGYFIVRNSRQHPEAMWEKIKKSNGGLILGIESVVEPVRIQLGKNFKNEDIDYHLDMAKQYEVPLLLLLIIGYPTETKRDFEYTKQWFIDRQEKINSIPNLTVMATIAAILPNTGLDRKQKEYGIVKGEVPTVWMTPVNAISTKERIEYLNEFLALLTELKIPVSHGNENTLEVAEQEYSNFTRL